jgi:PKD repeat protein
VLDSLDVWNIGVNDITADFDFTDQNGMVTFADQSVNALTYAWDFGDTNTSTDQNPTHTYTADGTYTVTLIVTSACASDTISQDITVVITGLNEQFKPIEMNAYPNPTRGYVTIVLTGNGNGHITLYDIAGKEVLRQSIALDGSVQSHNIDTSALATGVYELQVRTENSYAHTSLVKH